MAFGNLTGAWSSQWGPVNPGDSVRYLVDTTTASAAGTRIYAGSGITLDTTTGYPELAGLDAGATTDVFGGVARSNVEWTAAESGVYVECWTAGLFPFYHSGAAITDVGAVFYVENANATYGPVAVLDTAPGNERPLGRCVVVDTTNNIVWLKVDNYVLP